MPVESIVPKVAWDVHTQAVNDVLNNTFEADLDTVSTHGAFRWDLTDTPIWYGGLQIVYSIDRKHCP